MAIVKRGTMTTLTTLVAVCAALIALGTADSNPPPCRMSVDWGGARSIGGVGTFDPIKYRNVHAALAGTEFTEEHLSYLLNTLNVNLGRQAFGAYGAGPDFFNPPSAGEWARLGAENVRTWKAYSPYKTYKAPDLAVVDLPDVLEKLNGEYERFGDFSMDFFENYYDPSQGVDCPRYAEGINEADANLSAINGDDNAALDVIVDFYHQFCPPIRARTSSSCPVLCGGYVASWVEYNFFDFGVYEDRLKKFIDVACNDIDFVSLHTYDSEGTSPDLDGKVRGSILEGIFDLVASYTRVRCNRAIPLAVTEYSMGSNGVWYTLGEDESKVALPQCDSRDYAILNTVSAMFVQFIGHPDELLKSIPFYTGRAEDETGTNTPWSLITVANGQESWTNGILFYQAVSEIAGDYRRVSFDCPNVYAHALVEGDTGFLIMKNVALEPIDLNIVYPSGGGGSGVEARRLTLLENGDPCAASQGTQRAGKPVLSTSSEGAPQQTSLVAEEFVIFKYSLGGAGSVTSSTYVSRYFSSTMMQPIVNGHPVTFGFSGVSAGPGTATVRLSIGRRQGQDFEDCSVSVDGTALPVGETPSGGELTPKYYQWGQMQYQFDASTLSGDPSVTVSCPGTDGHISTVVLEVESFGGGSSGRKLETGAERALATDEKKVKVDAVLRNGGFESGADAWETHGSARIARWGATEGRSTVHFAGQGEVRQTVEVEPNTEYELTAMARVQKDGHEVQLTVEDLADDGNVHAQLANSRTWMRTRTYFYSGSSTSATIVLRTNPEHGAHASGWVDEVTLHARGERPEVGFTLPMMTTEISSKDFDVSIDSHSTRSVELTLSVKDDNETIAESLVTVPAGRRASKFALPVVGAVSAGREYELVARRADTGELVSSIPVTGAL